MTDILIILTVAAIVALAGWYVYRSKKRGQKCIGCPEGSCSGSCSCCNK